MVIAFKEDGDIGIYIDMRLTNNYIDDIFIIFGASEKDHDEGRKSKCLENIRCKIPTKKRSKRSCNLEIPKNGGDPNFFKPCYKCW